MFTLSANKLLAVLASSLAFAAGNTDAAEFQRSGLVVKRWVVIGDNRPALPASQNFYRFYVEPESWGASTCRADTVDVPVTNCYVAWALLLTSNAGQFSNQDLIPNLEITVDDTLRPIDGTCQAVAATLSPQSGLPAFKPTYARCEHVHY